MSRAHACVCVCVCCFVFFKKNPPTYTQHTPNTHPTYTHARARARKCFFCTGVLLLRREPRISRSAQVDELAEE